MAAGAKTGLVRTWPVAAGFAALSLGFVLVLNLSGPPANAAHNPSLLEARSLLNSGTLVLPERLHDTALVNGDVLNIFQPGQTLVFLVHLILAGEEALTFWKAELFGLFLASAVLCGIAMVRLSGGRHALAVPLAASCMFGAPYIASLPNALEGAVHRTNHVAALVCVCGALVLLAGRLSSRALWSIGFCLGAAMIFRVQTVLLLAVPIALLFQDAEGQRWTIADRFRTAENRRRLFRALGSVCAGPFIAALLVAAFNLARFGSPLESGYAAIYEGRTDYLALRVQEHGLWSLSFLKENLWRTLFALPTVTFDGLRMQVTGHPLGNSLLFSQPILIAGLIAVGSLRVPRVQAFALGTVLLAVPVLTYHNPGLQAPGYMRYSLDYLLPLVATMAVALRYRGTSDRWAPVFAIAALWAMYYGVALVIMRQISAAS